MTRRLSVLGCAEAGRCTGLVCRYYLEPTSDGEEPLCVLDVADSGPQTLDTIGVLLGLSRERVRQIEVEALRKLAGRFPLIAKMDAATLAESWSSSEYPLEPDVPYEDEFKRAVRKSYNRIVKGISS